MASRGHSRSTFVVQGRGGGNGGRDHKKQSKRNRGRGMGGMGGTIKSKVKGTGGGGEGGGVKPICAFAVFIVNMSYGFLCQIKIKLIIIIIISILKSLFKCDELGGNTSSNCLTRSIGGSL